MRRLIKGRTDLTLRQYPINVGELAHCAHPPNPLKPVTLAAPTHDRIHMQLHDNFLRARQATFSRTPHGNNLAGRRSEWRLKMIQAALWVG